ncbi:MAG: hypothetical protein PHE55_13460 [Methylococcaceae bacterium]|nr:hypothetical protein [Methylococcaceae bacterium]
MKKSHCFFFAIIVASLAGVTRRSLFAYSQSLKTHQMCPIAGRCAQDVESTGNRGGWRAITPIADYARLLTLPPNISVYVAGDFIMKKTGSFLVNSKSNRMRVWFCISFLMLLFSTTQAEAQNIKWITQTPMPTPKN